MSLWGCDRDISVARQTDYLVAWPRALGIERAVLVGHDLGGGVAQITAVRHRDMVEGLVLMNAICYDSWPVPSVKVMGALGSLVSRLPDALFQQVFHLFLLQGHRTPQQAAKAFRTHWPHYAAHGGSVDTKLSIPITANLPTVSQSTLLPIQASSTPSTAS